MEETIREMIDSVGLAGKCCKKLKSEGDRGFVVLGVKR